MASLLEALMSPTEYKRKRKNERTSASANALAEIIGQQAQEGSAAYDMADLDIFEGQDVPSMMTDASPRQDATGMYRGATDTQATQLDQLIALAQSGDPTLQSIGMEQYAEFIEPDATTTVQGTSDARNYESAKAGGYTGTFFEYQRDLKRAGSGVDPTSTLPLKPSELQRYQIENSEGVRMPVRDVRTSLKDIQQGTINNQPLPPGSKYIAAPTIAKQALEQKFTMATDVLAEGRDMLFGEDGIMNDESYSTSVKGQIEQIGQHWTQEDPRYSTYTSFSTGTISSIVKSMGEAGALAEGDVARALSLVPKLGVIDPFTGIYQKGDTRDVSLRKYSALEKLLNKWSGKQPTKEEAKKDLDEIFKNSKIQNSNELERQLNQEHTDNGGYLYFKDGKMVRSDPDE